MQRRLANIQMDEEHSRAICAEIGDRLRIALGAPGPIPPHLARLIAKLDELDEHDSPSIVPSIEMELPAEPPMSPKQTLSPIARTLRAI
jgi:hypothetical protein